MKMIVSSKWGCQITHMMTFDPIQEWDEQDQDNRPYF